MSDTYYTVIVHELELHGTQVKTEVTLLGRPNQGRIDEVRRIVGEQMLALHMELTRTP